MFAQTPNTTVQKRESSFFKNRVSPLKHWKNKRYQEMQLKRHKKSIFGQHYNYNYNQSALNKEKKYMIQQQRHTEIQRANRILFQKIKKIGQRSAHFPKNKLQTQQIEQLYRINNRTKYALNGRKQLHFQNSQNMLQQSQVSQFNTPRKLLPTQNLMIFKGYKQIDGVNFKILIYLEGGMYIILSEQGKMEHKIQMTLQNYRLLFKQSLDCNHENIFGMLKFNGTLLELAGTKRQQINIIEEEQLVLPVVNTNTKQKRSYTTN